MAWLSDIVLVNVAHYVVSGMYTLVVLNQYMAWLSDIVMVNVTHYVVSGMYTLVVLN